MLIAMAYISPTYGQIDILNDIKVTKKNQTDSISKLNKSKLEVSVDTLSKTAQSNSDLFTAAKSAQILEQDNAILTGKIAAKKIDTEKLESDLMARWDSLANYTDDDSKIQKGKKASADSIAALKKTLGDTVVVFTSNISNQKLKNLDIKNQKLTYEFDIEQENYRKVKAYCEAFSIALNDAIEYNKGLTPSVSNEKRIELENKITKFNKALEDIMNLFTQYQVRKTLDSEEKRDLSDCADAINNILEAAEIFDYVKSGATPRAMIESAQTKVKAKIKETKTEIENL